MTAGTRPSRTSGNPNWVPSSATAISQAAARPAPPPSAAPWIRPTTGRGHSSTARSRDDTAAASRSFSSRVNARLLFIHSASAPEQNTGPTPARTSTLDVAGRDTTAAVKSAIRASLRALRTSGRHRRIVVTPSRNSVLIVPIASHPEDRNKAVRDRGVQGRREGQRDHGPRLGRVDHPVIPEPRRTVIGISLPLVLLQDWTGNGALLFRAHRLLLAGKLFPLHLDQDAGRLLRAHDGNPGIGPRKEEAGTVTPAAHVVVSGPVGGADDHGDLGHRGGRDGLHHLGAVPGDPALFVPLADHESGDVLQEHQGNPPFGAQLDEVGSLEGALAEEHSVVGD